MKKTLLIAAMLLFVSNSFAQLVVDSLGRVGIGSLNTPVSPLVVGQYGWTNTGCSFNLNKIFGMRIYNHPNSTLCDTIRALDVYCKPASGISVGVRTISDGAGNYFSGGLMGFAGNATYSCGVYGAKGINSNVTHFAGICGSTSGLPYPYTPQGMYAGFFFGDVRSTGGYYGSFFTPTSSKSAALSNGTLIATESEDMTCLEKLQQVETIQFLRESQKVTDAEGKEIDDITQTQLSNIMYGLDYEQLKKVYPELVYEDKDNGVNINYVEMVPVLVKCINELSKELEELKGNSSKKVKTRTTAIEESTAEVDMVRMDQNKPNPFSESTVIKLNIPKDTKAATILIYDLSGKQVKSIPISERGKTDITVYASDLTPGMYIYNLVVDGQVKVTRKMIVSEV